MTRSVLTVTLAAIAVICTATFVHAQDECLTATAATTGVTPLDTSTLTDSPEVFAITQCELNPLGIVANDGWLEFTPLMDGLLTVSTCSSATFDTDIVVYEGSCGNLTQISCNGDNAACLNFSSETPQIQVSSAQTIFVRIGGFDATQSGLVNVTLTLDPFPAAPVNDDCATAQSVMAGPIAFDNNNALDSGEPVDDTLCAGTLLGLVEQDLWYSFTAPSDGLLDATTCNAATFITDLIVYEGGCGALMEVDCNGVATACGNQAEVQDVPVTAGMDYLIRLGGFDGFEVGTGTLDIVFVAAQPTPANDECAGATLLAGPGSVMADTLFATTSADPFDGTPCIATDPGTLDRDVWIEYQPSMDGLAQFTVDTMGNGVDASMAVYDGSCGVLNQLACNGDQPASFDPQINDIPITVGTSILVRVGGFNVNEAGPFTLTAVESPILLPITGLDCPADAGGTVEWTNGQAYDSITVIVDGNASVIGGTDESFPLPPLAGDFTVEVFGTVGAFSTQTVMCDAMTTCFDGAPRYSNTTNLVADDGTSLSCAQMGTGFTAQNFYLQPFDPVLVGIPQTVEIQAVSFVVEASTPGPGFATQPVRVRLLTDANAGPPTPLTALVEVASTTIEVPALAQPTTICAPIAATVVIPAGGSLVMSVEVDDATIVGEHQFFIGSNATPGLSPSYLAAATCGIANPTPADGVALPFELNFLFEIVEDPGDLFIRGQCDNNANFALSDAIFLLGVLFVVGSDSPSCEDACDIDDSGVYALGDVILLLSNLFGLTPPPIPAPAPGGPCGPDPTPGDALDCDNFDFQNQCP